MDKYIQRFWLKVNKTPNGCWEWTGAKSDGYGYAWFSPKRLLAHRVSYELTKGKIPEGLVLDHLCRNRGCVNPEHLEPVTNVENVLRGFGAGAINAVKNHCKRGHLFTEENSYKVKDGKGCVECRRIYRKKISQVIIPKMVHKNINRGTNKDRSKCINGHKYTTENIYLRKDGKKECVTCRHDRNLRKSKSISLAIKGKWKNE